MGSTLLDYILVLQNIYWVSNGNPSWSDYFAIMSGRLIALDKQLVVRLVGVGEMWRHLFANILVRFTGTEAIMAC